MDDWLLIFGITVVYMFIGTFVGWFATDDGNRGDVVFLGIFWPLVIAAYLIVQFFTIPTLLADWVKNKVNKDK